MPASKVVLLHRPYQAPHVKTMKMSLYYAPQGEAERHTQETTNRIQPMTGLQS